LHHRQPRGRLPQHAGADDGPATEVVAVEARGVVGRFNAEGENVGSLLVSLAVNWMLALVMMAPGGTGTWKRRPTIWSPRSCRRRGRVQGRCW
jgi:hypothetical protein